MCSQSLKAPGFSRGEALRGLLLVGLVTASPLLLVRASSLFG